MEANKKIQISVVIPAKNEASSIKTVVLGVREACPEAEIIVVDDGSTDETGKLALEAGALIVSHSYSKGNGAAIKSGSLAATGDALVFMDGDGQHNPADITRLLLKFEKNYDMIVGARKKGSQANIFRSLANGIYNKLASYMTGHRVEDLTSGFRVVRASRFREFLHLLPNGFSYPTTCTMAFFRAGYSVGYEPIFAEKRNGKSHINLLKDGTRFLLIIFKVGTLYSPLKLFAPLAFAFFALGLGWYAYTFTTINRFTNMSALLMSSGFIIFMMGLISEQITTLMYRPVVNIVESKNLNSND